MKPNSYPGKPEAAETQIPDEFDQAFNVAHTAVLKLTRDSRFEEDCRKKGIDPEGDFNTPAYWSNVASYAGSAAKGMRKHFEAKFEDSPPEVDAFELLAATPQFLFTDHRIIREGHEPTDRERSIQRHFNSLIRDIAAKHLNVRPSTMTRSLLHMAGAAIEDKNIRQSAAQSVRERIRGAQHELAFGQVLHYTGRQYGEADDSGDKNGYDYLVSGDSRILFVDVKASTEQTDGKAFLHRSDGRIVMPSVIRDGEFHDSFFVDDDLARERVPILNELLRHAEYRTSVA